MPVPVWTRDGWERISQRRSGGAAGITSGDAATRSRTNPSATRRRGVVFEEGDGCAGAMGVDGPGPGNGACVPKRALRRRVVFGDGFALLGYPGCMDLPSGDAAARSRTNPSATRRRGVVFEEGDGCAGAMGVDGPGPGNGACLPKRALRRRVVFGDGFALLGYPGCMDLPSGDAAARSRKNPSAALRRGDVLERATGMRGRWGGCVRTQERDVPTPTKRRVAASPLGKRPALLGKPCWRGRRACGGVGVDAPGPGSGARLPQKKTPRRRVAVGKRQAPLGPRRWRTYRLGPTRKNRPSGVSRLMGSS